MSTEPANGGEASELAIQAIALARLAGGLAHEVKNPLNAMALQLALLGDKIAADERLATSCAANLASMKAQIGRINEVVRRFVEVADPSSAPGSFDAGGLLADVANLFGHELRRRRIALECGATPGVVRAVGDGIRPTRLLLGLFWRAVLRMPQGGRLVVRAAIDGGFAELSIEHPIASDDSSLDWIDGTIAAAAGDLGGGLEQACDDGMMRVALRLPKEAVP